MNKESDKRLQFLLTLPLRSQIPLNFLAKTEAHSLSVSAKTILQIPRFIIFTRTRWCTRTHKLPRIEDPLAQTVTEGDPLSFQMIAPGQSYNVVAILPLNWRGVDWIGCMEMESWFYSYEMRENTPERSQDLNKSPNEAIGYRTLNKNQNEPIGYRTLRIEMKQ